MTSTENSILEGYKFAYFTCMCILWLYYIEKCKKLYFNNVIHMCFRIFRLSLNKTDYNCYNAAVNELTL